MGYIGEHIRDGRWKKIVYDNINDYCIYCKHQGYKESDCIVKQTDEESKKKIWIKINKTKIVLTMFKKNFRFMEIGTHV